MARATPVLPPARRQEEEEVCDDDWTSLARLVAGKNARAARAEPLLQTCALDNGRHVGDLLSFLDERASGAVLDAAGWIEVLGLCENAAASGSRERRQLNQRRAAHGVEDATGDTWAPASVACWHVEAKRRESRERGGEREREREGEDGFE